MRWMTASAVAALLWLLAGCLGRTPTPAPPPLILSSPSATLPAGSPVGQAAGSPLAPAPRATAAQPGAARPPAAAAEMAIPTPTSPKALPAEMEVWLLMGSDSENGAPGRTDSIHLVFLQRSSGGVSLVSLPRDLYVYLPGVGMERINLAYATGGPDLAAQTLEYNLGVRPQHWVVVSYAGLRGLVDAVGGVEVEVSQAFPQDCGGIPLGSVKMDGTTALCYLRERQTTSDIDRSRRQQEFLQAFFQQALRPEVLLGLPELFVAFQDVIHSDMDFQSALGYLPEAFRVQQAGFTAYQIGWEQVQTWRTPDNESVLLPKPAEIQAVLDLAIQSASQSGGDPRWADERLRELTALPYFTAIPYTPAAPPAP